MFAKAFFPKTISAISTKTKGAEWLTCPEKNFNVNNTAIIATNKKAITLPIFFIIKPEAKEETTILSEKIINTIICTDMISCSDGTFFLSAFPFSNFISTFY